MIRVNLRYIYSLGDIKGQTTLLCCHHWSQCPLTQWPVCWRGRTPSTLRCRGAQWFSVPLSAVINAAGSLMSLWHAAWSPRVFLWLAGDGRLIAAPIKSTFELTPAHAFSLTHSGITSNQPGLGNKRERLWAPAEEQTEQPWDVQKGRSYTVCYNSIVVLNQVFIPAVVEIKFIFYVELIGV